MTEDKAEVEVALIEVTASGGPGTEVQHSGRYGFEIKVDGRKIAGSLVTFDSREDAREALMLLRDLGGDFPIPD